MGDQFTLTESGGESMPVPKKRERCKTHAWGEWEPRSRMSTRMCRLCPEVEIKLGSPTVPDELTQAVQEAVARRHAAVFGAGG